jgi:carboxyl-terminal processing protease
MSKVKWIMVFCVCGFLSFAQNNSVVKTDSRRVENLASLAKVWGFLKYYHPTVAKGDFNWDEQLLLMIPKVEGAQNKEDLSKIYLEWIAGLGTVKECKSCKEVSKKEYFDKNFDLSWLNDSTKFTTELSQKLKFIEVNRFQGKSKYVSKTSNGNIVQTNEPQYKDFEYPDGGHRLLSLFKYWNTVEYFFPYKYLTDQNWNNVLVEMISKFENANNAMAYHLAMLETVVKVDDTHALFKTNYTVKYFGTKFIPAKFKIIDNKAVVTGFFYNDSLAKINDLGVGDVIETIENETVNEALNKKIKYISGSNYATKLRDNYYTLFNGNNDSLHVVMNRNNISIGKSIKMYSGDEVFKDAKSKSEKHKIIDNNIGYVDMALLKLEDVNLMMKSLANTKGVIFDIRNYPNFLPFLISDFINSEKRSFLKISESDLSYPGRFILEKKTTGKSNKNSYKGKIVLLVNEETQSRAEFSTMLLQVGDNVTTIGSQTAGADGNISRFEFIGGYSSIISGTGIYYPDGRETQRVGVKIDIEVKPTIKGIQEGRDEVLEAAKEYLNKPSI